MEIVLYAIGSPIVVDVEETCARLGVKIVAKVKNFEGPDFGGFQDKVFKAASLSPGTTRTRFIVPLFGPQARQAAVADAQRRGFEHPATLVDPTAVVASTTDVQSGTYINSAAIVGAAAKIGKFAFINRAAKIGHHAELSDFVSIGPGANLTGNVRIETGAFIGAGAIVLPEVTIGAGAMVGAGAVVTKSVAAGSVVTGMPARALQKGHGAGA